MVSISDFLQQKPINHFIMFHMLSNEVWSLADVSRIILLYGIQQGVSNSSNYYCLHAAHRNVTCSHRDFLEPANCCQ